MSNRGSRGKKSSGKLIFDTIFDAKKSKPKNSDKEGSILSHDWGRKK